jgi:ketosteroid isomerase-like protein
MKWLTLVLVLATLPRAALPQAASSPTAASQIRHVLEQQQEAWNRHDLDTFMRFYWNSPELTFLSGANLTRGWQPTWERYRKTYQSECRQMGKLDFSDLQIEPLGPEAAFVRGAFHLQMPDGKQPHGRFTLIFRKFADGWRIVHDHTCAAPQ